MRNVIAVGFAVFGLVAISGQALLTVPIQAQQVQMTICHFGGHVSADDVRDFEIDLHNNESVCVGLGENVITISAKAAEIARGVGL